jgi:hypothetical protein
MPTKKVHTFDKEMSLSEAELEKQKGTDLGESLKQADALYEKRRRK